jgi:exosortase A-associated hydrolase 1
MSAEIPVRFSVEGATRIGIVHLPVRPLSRGVLIVVGGWQYRVGSHRQFVLLGRALADAGFAVMRFDSRGMGDSDGDPGIPEPAEHLAQDIRDALRAFAARAAGVREFVLLGLCDGASAALMYAPTDPRVCGLVLLNPWVSNEQGAARTVLRHYYRRRLCDPELWRKIAAGEFDFHAFARSLLAALRAARGVGRVATACKAADLAADAGARIDRAMAQALDAFAGHILLVLSGRDRTAAEYSDVVAGSSRWRMLLRNGRAVRLAMPDADHTFSRRELRDALARDAVAWLRSWEYPRPRARVRT